MVSSPWKHICASLSTGCLFYFSPLNALKPLCPEGQRSAPEGQRSARRDCMMTWSILSLFPPTRRMITVLALSETCVLHSMQSLLLTARSWQKCHFVLSSQNVVPPTTQLCLSIIKAYFSAQGKVGTDALGCMFCFVLIRSHIKLAPPACISADLWSAPSERPHWLPWGCESGGGRQQRLYQA